MLQVMAFCLHSAKPLPEPLTPYQNRCIFNFHLKIHLKCHLQNDMWSCCPGLVWICKHRFGTVPWPPVFLGCMPCTLYPMKYIKHMVMLCFVLLWLYCQGSGGFLWSIYPYFSSGLLHWHWGNPMIAPVPVKLPWSIWAKSTYQPRQNKTKHEPHA